MLSIIARTILIFSLFLAHSVSAQQGYETLDPPVPMSSDQTAQVLEFFWYGCPHCNAFHPHIDAWEKRKPNNVEFKLVAAPLNPSWTMHSRAYYAAEVLGEVKTFHDAFFNVIHKQRKAMRDPDDIAAFAGTLGLDESVFRDTMFSFAVETRLRHAMQLAEAYKITGVPTVAVNGKYKTSASEAGGYARMINVLDDLLKTELGT